MDSGLWEGPKFKEGDVVYRYSLDFKHPDNPIMVQICKLLENQSIECWPVKMRIPKPNGRHTDGYLCYDSAFVYQAGPTYVVFMRENDVFKAAELFRYHMLDQNAKAEKRIAETERCIEERKALADALKDMSYLLYTEIVE